MAVRIISSVVAIPLLLIFIILGGLPLRLAVLALSLIGQYELYKAVSGKFKLVHIFGFALELAYSCLLYCYQISGEFKYLFGIGFTVAIAVPAVLLTLVFAHRTNNINDGSITIFGFFYVGVLMSLICEIRSYGGMMYAWLPFIFAFGSDTGAYFSGKAFGKHKLTPELSPKKTVEGAIGGVVTVAVLTCIYFTVCSKLYDNVGIESIAVFTAVGAIGAVFSQLGDLAASSIKRYVNIKDYGWLMPGHGGVMDRFDSVLFTIPLVFAVVWLMGMM
jgi:phosphatidate cytidylyltransferase